MVSRFQKRIKPYLNNPVENCFSCVTKKYLPNNLYMNKNKKINICDENTTNCFQIYNDGTDLVIKTNGNNGKIKIGDPINGLIIDSTNHTMKFHNQQIEYINMIYSHITNNTKFLIKRPPLAIFSSNTILSLPSNQP